MVSAIGFNPYVQSSTLIDPTIKAQLDSLGLQSTGNAQKDIAAIQAAKASQGSNSAQNVDDANKASTLMSSQAQPSSSAQPPWASLMQQLGLSLTGSKEGDFSAIATKLSSLQASAKTDSEKANVAALQAQFQAYASQADSSAQSSSSTPFAAEQNQIAQLNKFFLVGSST